MAQRKNGGAIAVALVVLALLASGLGVDGYLRADETATALRTYLINDGGPVLFEHAEHAARAEACIDCHHDLAGETVGCLECHEEDEGIEPGEAGHVDLVEIHEADCAGCHEIAPDEDAESCRECHEQPSEVYHLSCTECHAAEAPERFVGAGGDAVCAACHLQ